MFYLITKIKFQDTKGSRERGHDTPTESVGPMMDVDIGIEVILFINFYSFQFYFQKFI